MKSTRFTWFRVALAMLGSFTLVGSANAEQYPSRPIKLIIPFAPGAQSDIVGRAIANHVSETLGQSLIIENISGGGGQIASKQVADAPPDGYTIGLGTVGTHAQSQTLYKKPQFNSETDFTPVGLIAEIPIVLSARKTFPVKDLQEFVAYTNANQAKMTYGTAGVGSAPHLACTLLNHTIGVNVTHVPYRGTGPATQDLLSGRIDFMCGGITTTKPLVNSGSLSGLAVLGANRSPVMPTLATASEQGTMVEAYTWNALFMPKGVPEPIVRKLNSAVIAAMKDPSVNNHLNSLGAEVVSETRASPEYLRSFLKSETEKWAKPILAGSLQVE